MERICTSLQRAGHKVTLVGRVKVASKNLVERPYAQHRIWCQYESGKAFYTEYNYRLVRELSSWDYDVICSVDVDTLAAGAALTRADRHQLVFDAHEWFHMTPEVVHRPLIRGFWKGLARTFIGRTDLRYTVAPQLAGKLAEDYGQPFETVRNLPWRSKMPAAPVPEKKIILYQGMLNPGRGLEVAIAAMDYLPDCELWLAGSGPEEGELRRCKKKLIEPGKVSFLGFVDPAELPGLTRQAWLGLNLLDAVSPSYLYSLANKALDYVQAGVPSVQMDFPEYRDLQERYGCYALLDNLQVDSLAAVIKRLSDDVAAYNDLRNKCLAAAPELCWEREEQVLLDLYDGLGKGTH